MLKLRDAQWFLFLWASVVPLWFFQVYSQEVRTEGKLNCNRAHQRCRLHSRSATYIYNAPPGHKMNLCCALLVNCCGATHICTDSNCTSVWGTSGVFWMAGAGFLGASSLIGPSWNLLNFIGWRFQPWLFNLPLQCALMLLNFFSVFASCE
jgi:hypothetical protein